MSCDAEVEDRTYTFDELSDKAKEKARETRRLGELDYGWWEHVYDDAVEMGKLLGCEIGMVDERTYSGETFTKPDIWFSGFSSQGDGCCWSGFLDAAKLQGAVERVKTEAPADEALHDLAKIGEELFGEIAAIAAVNRLSEGDSDWPEVEITMRLTVIGLERSYSTQVDDNFIPREIDKTADKLVTGFADWIYDQLEAEHDYRLSDENIDEQIKADDLQFDEDGNTQ